MTTKVTSKPDHSNLASVFVSIPSAVLWILVGGFLFKWYRAWATGNLEPGLQTSWPVLYLLFAVAVLAVAAGGWLTIMAWIGKSTIKWQIVSVVLGVLFLWMVAGD